MKERVAKLVDLYEAAINKVKEANDQAVHDFLDVIPAAKAKALKDGGYVGKTVVMGIRPEDVADRADGSMSSTVKVYELLGAEVFLYFDVNGTQITARVDPGTKAKTGDPVKFDFNMEKTHFFDKDTELVITN